MIRLIDVIVIKQSATEESSRADSTMALEPSPSPTETHTRGSGKPTRNLTRMALIFTPTGILTAAVSEMTRSTGTESSATLMGMSLTVLKIYISTCFSSMCDYLKLMQVSGGETRSMVMGNTFGLMGT